MKMYDRLGSVVVSAIFFFGALFPPLLFGNQPPEVEVWLDRGDGGVYYDGDAMTIYFKANRPAYVTVYNIDSEGFVNILFPYYPGMDNYVAGGKTYTIPGGGYDLSLYIDEPVGIGYIEAVVSDEPFDLDRWPFLSRSDEPTEAVEVIRQISGDPFLAIEEINGAILPYSEEPLYQDDFAIYYIEEIVHYPRYLCSDCHVPSYYHYDPYHYYCPSYYIIVYDYWYYNNFCYWDFYYPYGYYDYYYYYPRSVYVGQRYSRKYDYRTRDTGIYRTKGEVSLSDGIIRSRERGEETRIVGPASRTQDEGTTLPMVSRVRETVSEENSPTDTPRPSHHGTAVEEQTSPGNEGALRRQGKISAAEESRPAVNPSRKPAVEESRPASSPSRKPAVEESRSSGSLSRKPVVEESRQPVPQGDEAVRVEKVEPSVNTRPMNRPRQSEQTDSAGDRESHLWRGTEDRKISEVRANPRRSTTEGPRPSISRDRQVRSGGFPRETESVRSGGPASRPIGSLDRPAAFKGNSGPSTASIWRGEWGRGSGGAPGRR